MKLVAQILRIGAENMQALSIGPKYKKKENERPRKKWGKKNENSGTESVNKIRNTFTCSFDCRFHNSF